MKSFRSLSTLFLFLFAGIYARAQTPPTYNGSDCSANTQAPTGFVGSACNFATNFSATPLIDGTGSSYGDHDANKVSLYGTYGNDEKTSSAVVAQNHYSLGVTLAANIKPRCLDGSIPAAGARCLTGTVLYDPAVVFLFIGFSHCDIEVCGGNGDAWDGQGDVSSYTVNGHLPGQPCATGCPNYGNKNTTQFPTIWNKVRHNTNNLTGGDNVDQMSLIRQVYGGATRLVGPNVVVFDGAFGSQTLERWDPTSSITCNFPGIPSGDTECNYDRVLNELQANGFSEQQVQAVFIKSANGFPECDLKKLYCQSQTDTPDAYTAEQHMGNILRYLRCCELTSNGFPANTSRYPNLQQVYIISRSYGGYANGTAHGCLNPEPFAYELGFSVQRAIVAQINQSATPPVTNSDLFSGDLHYNPSPNGTAGNGAPWVDWGPYIWASGTNQSPGNLLRWCDSTTTGITGCQSDPGDFRFGDLGNSTVYWGDHTHPTSNGLQKVATQLVEWFQGTLPAGEGNISDWVHTWVTTQ